MKCIITGTETNNKWKGKPVCKNALIQAREYMDKDPKLTMRNALKKVQAMFAVAINHRIDEKIKNAVQAKEAEVGD